MYYQSNGKETYAGISTRAFAYIADCLILFAGLIVWQAALYLVNPIVAIINSGRQPTGAQIHLWVFATASVPFLLYFALTQSSARRATFGMRFLKIKVTRTNGDRIRFGRASLRNAVLLIPFEINHAIMFHLAPQDGNSAPSPLFWFASGSVWILMAGYVVSILLTRRRQSLHDLIASTVVQKVSTEPEN